MPNYYSDIFFALAQELHRLRLQQGKSIRELSKETGISPQILGLMESGVKVNKRHYFKLMAYYNCEISVSLTKKHSQTG